MAHVNHLKKGVAHRKQSYIPAIVIADMVISIGIIHYIPSAQLMDFSPCNSTCTAVAQCGMWNEWSPVRDHWCSYARQWQCGKLQYVCRLSSVNLLWHAPGIGAKCPYI